MNVALLCLVWSRVECDWLVQQHTHKKVLTAHIIIILFNKGSALNNGHGFCFVQKTSKIYCLLLSCTSTFRPEMVMPKFFFSVSYDIIAKNKNVNSTQSDAVRALVQLQAEIFRPREPLTGSRLSLFIVNCNCKQRIQA